MSHGWGRHPSDGSPRFLDPGEHFSHFPRARTRENTFHTSTAHDNIIIFVLSSNPSCGGWISGWLYFSVEGFSQVHSVAQSYIVPEAGGLVSLGGRSLRVQENILAPGVHTICPFSRGYKLQTETREQFGLKE